MHKKIINKLKSLNKNHILIGVAVLAILVTGVLVSSKSNPAVLSFLKFNGGMSKEAIAKKSIDYLNKSVLQNGQTATLVSVSDLKGSGVVQIKVKIADKEYDSYATKDGKLLFPQAFAISPTATASAANNQPSNNQTAQTAPTNKGEITPATVVKVTKPSLETFIVSSCPFGLQAQRAMAEAVKNIPALADYIKVRYIGSISGDTTTAMHGPDEAKNDRIQMCIREEQPSKYWAYVGCYMKNATGKAANGMPYGDTETCQKTAGVDIAKLNACMSDPNRVLKYAKEDFDLAGKIGAQGSPTFSLNGAEVSETPFGGRSADAIRNLVCSSSQIQPDFCSKKLDTNPAATSFSVSYK